jgi:hypothetical protein
LAAIAEGMNATDAPAARQLTVARGEQAARGTAEEHEHDEGFNTHFQTFHD